MRIRQPKLSVRRPGGICACAVPIIPMPICPNGWKESCSQPWEKAFVFFKHEEEAKGPEMAIRFRELTDARCKKNSKPGG